MAGGLRILFLGGGAVVREYWLAALAQTGELAGALVVDHSGEELAKVRAAWPVVSRQRADFKTFLHSGGGAGFDLAVIALPNALHSQAVELGLQAGLNLLCEKPLALTEAACRRMAEQAEQAGRLLAVNMVRRLLPEGGRFREVLDSGRLGTLRSVSWERGEPYGWLSDSGDFFRPENGGVLADMGIHHLDRLEQALGPLTPARYEDDARGGVEANASFDLENGSGVPVRLRLSRTRRLKNHILLEGSAGRETIEEGELSPAHFTRQLRIVLDHLAGGPGSIVTARQAASTVALVEWAYRNRRSALPATAGPRLEPAPTVVTGGTGFIGSHLVERLTDLGFREITVPVRNYRSCAEVGRFPVRLPQANLLNRDSVRAMLRGARWVFHCAYGKEDPRITVAGTRQVVEGAIAGGAECVVILSSAAVFGDASGVVDETAPYAPRFGAYGRSKMRMEQWCLRRARRSPRTRIVLLDPTNVYGPRGGPYTRLPAELVRAGRFLWIEAGRGAANIVYVANLVDAMLLAAGSREAHGRRFLINDGTTTWREFLTPLFGEAAGRLRSVDRAGLERLQGEASRPSLVDRLKPIVRPIVPPSLRDVLRRRLGNRAGGAAPEPPPLWLWELYGPTTARFSSASAARILGWRPRVDSAAARQATVAWLKQEALWGSDGAA